MFTVVDWLVMRVRLPGRVRHWWAREKVRRILEDIRR